MEILKGKIALITGASGGIGSCIARRFAQDGISLALLGRSKEKLAATAASVREYGVETLLLPGDLLDDAYLEDCFAAVKERFGGLDILVNNAGIALSRSFEETTMAEFDRIMALNARVPYLACHLALPLLRCSECASILNIASVVAHKGYPWQSIYAASKHAVLGLSKSLANEVYTDGVRVHVIAPGGVYTEMVAKVRPDLDPSVCMLPEDIAEAAAFFVEHRTNAVVDEIRLHRANNAPFA